MLESLARQRELTRPQHDVGAQRPQLDLCIPCISRRACCSVAVRTRQQLCAKPQEGGIGGKELEGALNVSEGLGVAACAQISLSDLFLEDQIIGAMRDGLLKSRRRLRKAMGASQGLSPRAPRRRIAWLGVLPALSPLEAKEMSPDRKTRQNIL